MTLLLTCLAAIVSTLVWYNSETARELKIGTLCYMYWGASLMWLVDAVFEYAELREEYFTPAIADVFNDFFLGIAVVVFGMLIWLSILLVKDPKQVVRQSITKKM